MLQIADLDKSVSVRAQLESAESGPIVVINTFVVPEADSARFVAAWAANASYFKRQPGFISTQLHQGLAGSNIFESEALWESLEKFRAAFANPDGQKTLALFPDGVTATPHLFRKVAVADICVA